MKRHDNQKGFTLVELLIVIVVIAILAAITIVAYNGVTQKAENTEIISNIEQVDKAVLMYLEEHGTPPLLGADNDSSPAYDGVCIGEGYPNQQCGLVTNNNGPTIPITENPAFCAALASYINCPIKPVTADNRFVFTDTTSLGENLVGNWLGAVYVAGYYDLDNPTRWTYIIDYELHGNVSSCGVGDAAVTGSASSFTGCAIEGSSDGTTPL